MSFIIERVFCPQQFKVKSMGVITENTLSIFSLIEMVKVAMWYEMMIKR